MAGLVLAAAALALAAATTVTAPAPDPIVAGAWRSPGSAALSPHPGRAGPLSADERAMAEAAWRYLSNNTQPATGLINAVEGYPSATLWDTGSGIAGIIAAHGLGLIDRAEAVRRLEAILITVARLPLFHDRCPNKAYDTSSAAKVGYDNKPGEIGCSALDVGRLLAAVRIAVQRLPELGPAADAAVGHLNVAAFVDHGQLQGLQPGPDGGVALLQEGRLGYEEYAAKAFRSFGLDVGEAARPQPYGTVTLNGVRIAYDARDPKVFGAHNYVVSESAVLDGVEFGWNEPDDVEPDAYAHRVGWYASLADALYRAQAARYQRTGILTARTEHQLLGPPYFVYDSLFSDGQAWATITDTGQSVPAAAAMASKAAVGLWALWATDYTGKLFAATQSLVRPERGVLEGRLESGATIETATLNTNGIILESLFYKVGGPLARPERARRLPAAAAAAAITPPVTPLAAPPPGSANAEPGRPRHGALTPAELEAARIAWRYFENNTQPRTGLVNAVDNYPSTTMWDTSAALAAIVAARELGLIDAGDAETRLRRIVEALGHLRLFRDRCPNKAYNTATLVPTDYGNVPAQIGCSAIDVGRVLVWMHVVADRYPALRPAVATAVAHFNAGMLVRNGELWGATLVRNQIELRQEGRLGYEEYAAKGFELWGHRAAKAASPQPYDIGMVEGVPVAHDRRDLPTTGGNNAVVTESAALDGIEFGWASPGASAPDPWTVTQARDVFLAQQRRYEHSGVLTARTEHQLLKAPHFVYDSIFANGRTWPTIDVSGAAVPGAAAVATKAAVAMWVLWPDAYSDLLFRTVIPGRDPARGFYEGFFEAGGTLKAFTANNNGIILEALLFKVRGPLITLGQPRP